MITPQNERHQRELAAIGYILAENGRPYLAGDFFAVCSPKCFVHRETSILAEAMAKQAASGLECGLVAVAGAMRGTGKLKDVGVADLSEIALQYGGALMGETGLMRAADEIAADWRMGKAQGDIAGIVRDMQGGAMSTDRVADDLRKAAALLEGDEGRAQSFAHQLDEYEKGLDSPERMARPVPTPWMTVNRILRGGVLPGELAVLAARPSVGKSAFALNWAYSVACSGKTSMIHSLEMPRQQLFDRLAANIGDIDLGRFREGLNPSERQRAKGAVATMRGKPLLIFDDTDRVTVGEIRRRARIAQRGSAQLGLVAVDYLQLVTPDDRKAPREQQVAQMSRSLKLMAKDLHVPVLLLAQLNRKNEEAKRAPMLSDLRESGAIEQDADIVIFLHQARQAWHPDEPVQVLVAKGRSSGVGREHLVFRRRHQRFLDSSEAAYTAATREEEQEQARHWTEAQGDLA